MEKERKKRRRTIADSIEEVQSRQYIIDLVTIKVPKVRKKRFTEHLIPRDQALISTIYLTAGRISEVLALTVNQFTEEDDMILVRDMIIKVKRKDNNCLGCGYVWRYKKNQDLQRCPNCEGSDVYTAPAKPRKRTIGIPINHPLVKYIINHIHSVKKGFLFPFTVRRAEQILDEIDKKIWCHYLRSQRITHLRWKDNGETFMETDEITKYVGWEKQQDIYFKPKVRHLMQKISKEFD